MISQNAILWLANGERGSSSNTMFQTFTGITALRWPDSSYYPLDPDDFQRCEKLLRQVPEFRSPLPMMGSVSSEWAGLVKHWDEIVAMFEHEAPGVFDGRNWTRANKTYELMEKAMKEKRGAT